MFTSVEYGTLDIFDSLNVKSSSASVEKSIQVMLSVIGPLLSDFGADGWELVGFAGFGDGISISQRGYVFKRLLTK